MSEPRSKQLSRVEGSKIVITRDFDAPIELVFQILTEEEYLMGWYCPSNFRMEHAEVDLKVGGRYRTTAKSLDGEYEYSLVGVFREIDEPRRIVETQQAEMGGGTLSPETTITIELEQSGSITKMRFEHDGFPDEEMANQSIHGWTEAFDKIDRIIETNT